MLPLVGIEPLAQDSKSNMLLPTLTCHVLLRRSLNFCSYTTWFLDLMIQLESIEHDYIRILKSQYYKQMSS